MNLPSPASPRNQQLRAILEEWPDLPFRDLPAIPPGALVAHSHQSLADDEFIFDEEGRGALSWCCLPWDSEIFGVAMARLDLLWALGEDVPRMAAMVDRALQEIRASGIRHVSHRTGMARVASIHLLEDRGFRLVDSLQTLYFRPAERLPEVAVRDYRPSDRDAILAMVPAVFQRNRFMADRGLDPARACETYVRWADNCLSGARGDWVGVRVLEGEPAGFVTCLLRKLQAEPELTVGVIDLVGVHGKFQGRGVGRELVQAAQNWLGPRSTLLTVGTRCDNFPALALYLQAGFRIYSSMVGMHAWLR